MGEAARKERRIKELTLAELRAEMNANFEAFLTERLTGLIDSVVQERIKDYHGLLVAQGRLVDPDSEPEPETKLWTPR